MKPVEGISRLVVEAKNALSIQFAVVFEKVSYIGDDTEPGYEWIDLSKWKDQAFAEESEEEVVNRRGTAVRSDITTKTNDASVYMDDGIAFTTYLEEFYTLLADVKYIIKAFYIKDENSFTAKEEALLESYEEYLDYEARYNTFADLISGTNEELLDLVDLFAGI